jgi:hypothetical protein
VTAALQALVDRGYVASTTALPPEEARIVPTRLDLRTVYIPGTATDRVTVWAKGHQYGSDITFY